MWWAKANATAPIFPAVSTFREEIDGMRHACKSTCPLATDRVGRGDPARFDVCSNAVAGKLVADGAESATGTCCIPACCVLNVVGAKTIVVLLKGTAVLWVAEIGVFAIGVLVLAKGDGVTSWAAIVPGVICC